MIQRTALTLFFKRRERNMCLFYCVYAGTKIKIKPKMNRLRMSEDFLGRRHSDAGHGWYCGIVSLPLLPRASYLILFRHV